MFVPHEPNNCFDVYRPSDRCVCGCSAFATSQQGENKGYCSKCSIKREEFVNRVIGNIYIGEESSVYRIILITIEQMRNLYFKERFYYMVDYFYAEHQNDYIFVDPYVDDEFVARMYYEKQVMTELFLKSLNSFSNLIKDPTKYATLKETDLSKCIFMAYENYRQQLLEMQKNDFDQIGILNSQIGGYEYKKKS